MVPGAVCINIFGGSTAMLFISIANSSAFKNKTFFLGAKYAVN